MRRVARVGIPLLLGFLTIGVDVAAAPQVKTFWPWELRPHPQAYRQVLDAWPSDPGAFRREASPGETAWRPLRQAITDGGRRLTGRLSALQMAPDPKSPGEQTLWVGASSGGLWVRDLQEGRWRMLSDSLQGSPSVGDFLVLPGGGIVLATGDPWRYPGSGIYRSDDSGLTWSEAGLPLTPSSIYRLAADRNDPDRLFAATPQGLLSSTDGGVLWTLRIAGHFTEICQDPHDAQRWFAGAFDLGVLRSEDGGESFLAANGDPPAITAPIGRVSLSLSQASPNLLFALVADFANTRGVFRSFDGGQTWDNVDGGPDVAWGQAFHTNAIAAHPTDADLLMVAQGGAKLTRNATEPVVHWEDLHDTGHADTTRLHWASEHELLVTNDGGVFRFDSDTHQADGALNQGLGVLQVYATGALVVDPNLPVRGWVGLQDNGVVRIDLSLPEPLQLGWGGDAGWVSAARNALNRVAAAVGLPFDRYLSLNGGDTFSAIRCVPGDVPGNPPLAFDPLPGGNNIPRLYTSAPGDGQINARLFRIDFSRPCASSVSNFQVPDSTGFGAAFLSLADDPDQLVAYLSPARSDSDHALARALSPLGSRNGFLDVERLPAPENRAGRFSAATGRPARVLWWPYEGLPTLWLNEARGEGMWQQITGDLAGFGEGLRIHRADSHPRVAGEMYLATNLGVLVSYDHGQHWRRFDEGLPAVTDAVDLRLAPDPQRPNDVLQLWLGTYGHGVWQRRVADGVLWADGLESVTTGD